MTVNAEHYPRTRFYFSFQDSLLCCLFLLPFLRVDLNYCLFFQISQREKYANTRVCLFLFSVIFVFQGERLWRFLLPIDFLVHLFSRTEWFEFFSTPHPSPSSVYSNLQLEAFVTVRVIFFKLFFSFTKSNKLYCSFLIIN